jgi:hypothetical protein
VFGGGVLEINDSISNMVSLSNSIQIGKESTKCFGTFNLLLMFNSISSVYSPSHLKWLLSSSPSENFGNGFLLL